MKSTLCLILALVLLCSTSSGQVRFRADLDGFQETPPVPGTLAGGWATLDLNTTTNRVAYTVRTFGLTGTMAHVHLGAPGVSGGIVFGLTGGPTTWTGLSPVLTPTQIDDLEMGLHYVNVHTAAFPGGEIRGQVLLNPSVFGTHMDQSQEVPAPSITGATGNGNLSLTSTNALSYSVAATGLSGPAFAAHVHSGAFGVPGGVEITLAGGPTAWAGTSLPLTLGQVEVLQNRGWYTNVHTAMNPNGEIRGQIVPSGIPYGPPSDPSTGSIRLRSTGAPTDVGGGGTFTLDVTLGKPFGLGYVFVALTPDAALFKDEPLLVNFGTLFNTTIVPLDAAGELHVSLVTPPIPASVDLFMQFFGLDNTAPNGQFNVSNGLVLPFAHF